MRVFIAIEFNNEVKEHIADIGYRINKYSIGGNYTPKDNLHMTIKFIGEVEKNSIKKIQSAMDKTVQSIPSFNIVLNNIGRFIQRGKSLIWMGVSEGTQDLLALHEALDNNLSVHGFPRDRRSFTPHITIGRKINLKLPFNALEENLDLEPMPAHIDSLTLMESTRVEGKLLYIPIYRSPLN